MTYTRERPRFRRGRGKHIKTKINGPHNTPSKPPQQHTKNEDRVERNSARKLSPYHFTVRNGAGVFRTNAVTLKQARAELKDFFGDEFVSVERYPRVDQ